MMDHLIGVTMIYLQISYCCIWISTSDVMLYRRACRLYVRTLTRKHANTFCHVIESRNEEIIAWLMYVRTTINGRPRTRENGRAHFPPMLSIGDGSRVSHVNVSCWPVRRTHSSAMVSERDERRCRDDFLQIHVVLLSLRSR